MTQEKKLFAPVVKTYNNDLSKRWRIEWYEPLGTGTTTKRIVRYLGSGKNSSLEQRMDEAERILSLANFRPHRTVKKDILQKALDFNKINYRKSTYRAYKTTLQHYIKFLNELPPEKATKSILNDYISHLQQEKASAKKIVKYMCKRTRNSAV